MTSSVLRQALVLCATFAVVETAHAACVRSGNPKAQEVELLSCTTAQTYFDANYEALHPPKQGGSQRSREDLSRVFAGQLSQQPGVVIKVKVLRLREYTDDPEYSWKGAWEEQDPVDRVLYIRQPDLTCDGFRQGDVVQFIWAPQCCDTGYFGEIGCHLNLPMMERLPSELSTDPTGGSAHNSGHPRRVA